MDDTPFQPADDLDILNDLLGRARYFILGLIGFIDTALERLGNTPLNAPVVRYLMRRALLPAEAALRRAILLIATTLPPLPPAPARAPSKGARQLASVTGKPAAPRAPLFRMSEPQPRPTHYRKTDYLSEDLMPRITLLTESVLRARPAPAQPPLPHDPAAAFYRRFEALRAAYDDPAPYARRWLRRRARSAADAARALAPVKIPGTRKPLGDNTISLLKELTHAARTRALTDTS